MRTTNGFRNRITATLIGALLIFAAHGAEKERAPVIFAPGLGMSAEIYRESSPLIDIFKERGYALKIADTMPYGTLSERVQSFIHSVNELLPSGMRFHIVGHSAGGLDARLAIHQDDFAHRVISLTTLASPHRGTSAAKYLLEYLIDHPNSFLPPRLEISLEDLTPESMSHFNSTFPNSSEINYFSMGFYIPAGPLIFYTFNPIIGLGHQILLENMEGPNDGIVSTRSAEWGKSLGNFPAEHFGEALEIPFAGKPRMREIFKRVIDNLDRIDASEL